MVGSTNLDKALGFHRGKNWSQTLRYGEIAATKLKQLKDRRLETVQAIDKALGCQFDSLQRLGRHREALECAKECYTLWAMNYLRNPGSMKAALSLIQSCIHNKEYEDAERYARHAYFMIAEMADNFIPSDQQPQFLAEVTYYLASSIYSLATAGGIPPEGKQKAGEEVIEHARKALEMRTQLSGTGSAKTAMAMGLLADLLDYFNDVDDDEVLRLTKQAIAICRRVEGISSVNFAVFEHQLGIVYARSARRALVTNDQVRCLTNLELSLPHYRDAARIHRANNHVDRAEESLLAAAGTEEEIRRIRIAIAATAGSVTEG